MRRNVLTVLAAIAAVGAMGLTFLPWIDLTEYGMPLQWNGLAHYSGLHPEHYGPLMRGAVNPVPGWMILISSAVAALSVVAAWRQRRAGFIALGCAFIAFGTAVVCLAYPALLVQDLRHQLGADSFGSRQCVNSELLIAVVATTSVLLISTGLSVGGRRTPPAAPHTPRPAHRRGPAAGA